MRLRSKTPLLLAGVMITIGSLLPACSRAPATLEADVPFFQDLTQAVASESPADILALVHFSTLPCTHADGLGGPPKCLPGEAEGARVEVLPILGPEGHHIRRSEFASWPGIGTARLYAVIRTDPGAFSDEFYPAGEYGVAFLQSDEAVVVVFQVTEQGIVRLDYHPRTLFDGTLEEADILLGPLSRS